MPSSEHGLWCDCLVCTIARNRRDKAEATQLFRTGSIDVRLLAGHGTYACYSRGCRQPDCVEACREYKREWGMRNRAAQPKRVHHVRMKIAPKRKLRKSYAA